MCGYISYINYVKIQYKCNVCKAEINNESICRNGCSMKDPFLSLQVLCQIEDGTSKASLELKNDKVKKVFAIGDDDQRRFKDYCLKYGAFTYPAKNHGPLYQGIQDFFQKICLITYSQMIFYCKPYYKSTYDPKQESQHQQRTAANTGGYNDTISKPNFLMKEREKEIYLNGEVTIRKDVPGFNGQGM